MSLRELIKQKLSDAAAPRRKKRTQQDKLRELAPFIIEQLLKAERVTLQDCAQFVGDRSTNSVATTLGRGTGGGGGANAWMFNGEVVACSENIAIFVRFLSAAAEEQLLKRLNATEEEFVKKAGGLPSGKVVLGIED